VGVLTDSRKFSGYPTAHREVIFALAQLSCSSTYGITFLWFLVILLHFLAVVCSELYNHPAAYPKTYNYVPKIMKVD